MAIEIRCTHPDCGKLVLIDEDFAGGKCPCPECGGIIEVTLTNLKRSGTGVRHKTDETGWHRKKRLLPFMREKDEMNKHRKRRTERIHSELDKMYPEGAADKFDKKKDPEEE